jgi:AraC family transcriptional regulator of adaptative response/methylated-DNA-[protein]-cysteine methyltransferase
MMRDMQTNDMTQANSLDLDETRWAAVVARCAPRQRHYCVKSDGVYCRPSTRLGRRSAPMCALRHCR